MVEGGATGGDAGSSGLRGRGERSGELSSRRRRQSTFIRGGCGESVGEGFRGRAHAPDD